jgi:two-component system LytT family sensor kinase
LALSVHRNIFKDKIGNNFKSITIHVLTWVLILLINYIFLKNYVIFFDLKFHILTWIVYICLFYICFSFLIPVFLLRKRTAAFLIGSILTIAVSYTIDLSLARNQSFTVFREMRGSPYGNFVPPFGRLQDSMKPPQLPMREFDRQDIKKPELERMLDARRPPRQGPQLLPLYGLLLVYFSSISIKVLLKFKDDETKEEFIHKERISTELSYLKQQVNPHFLFNTLNNIYSLSIKNPALTPEAILKVSSILRYTLYKSDQTLALLKEEIEIINAYLELQNMRFKDKLPLKYSIEGEVGEYKVEPFIMLPLVENAIKFGMSGINDSFINISITIKSGTIKFFISNKINLIESDTEHSGIGIKNIKRRLDLVYPDSHKFEITDEAGIFSVLLELPLST